MRVFYRFTAYCGLLSAAILLFNAARRLAVVPANDITRGIAPLSAALGLVALTGFYLAQRQESGSLGLAGYATSAIGLAGVVGVEVASNWVFPYLDAAVVTSLVAGPTGKLFLSVAVILIVGTMLFGAAIWRAGRFPRALAAPYVIGLTLTAFRAALPVELYLFGLVVAALTTAALAVSLLRMAADTDSISIAESAAAL